MKTLTKAGVVVASAGLLVGGWAASTASASGSGQNLPTGKATTGAAAAAAAPLARVFAVVNADGTKVRGKGLSTVSRVATGVYNVRFNRNITTCSWVGTVGFGGFSGSTGPGQITITGLAGTNNGLFVTTFNGSGVTADEPFHADVICS